MPATAVAFVAVGVLDLGGFSAVGVLDLGGFSATGVLAFWGGFSETGGAGSAFGAASAKLTRLGASEFAVVGSASASHLGAGTVGGRSQPAFGFGTRDKQPLGEVAKLNGKAPASAASACAFINLLALSANLCMLALWGGICMRGSLGGPTGEAAIGAAPKVPVSSINLFAGLGGLHTLAVRRLGSILQSWGMQAERALAFLMSRSSEATSRFTILDGGVVGSPRLKESSVDVRLYPEGEGVPILDASKTKNSHTHTHLYRPVICWCAPAAS